MITAIVNFKLPAEIDAKKAAELFKGSAPKYRGMKGLVRKYYLFDEQSRIGGGVYLLEEPGRRRRGLHGAMEGLHRRALRRAAGHPLFRDRGGGRQR